MPWSHSTDTKTFQEQLDAAYAKAEQRKLAKNGKSHCSAWYRGNIFKYAEGDMSTEHLMKLTSIRRSMADFATIVLGRTVPVSFSSDGTSFSSVKGAEELLVVSATTDPNRFDCMCGVMLHEASHIKWTNYSFKEPDSVPLFSFLDRFIENPEEFIPVELIALGRNIPMVNPDLLRDFKFLLNVIEDRRIDRLMYEEAPGYRPYYEAMYDEYWHTPEISKWLLSPTTHEPLVEFYRFHICNMTNDYANPTVLPGLQEIHDLINLPEIKRFSRDSKWQSYPTMTVPDPKTSIRYPVDELPDMVQLVFKIMTIIYTNSTGVGNSLPPDTNAHKKKWKKGMKFTAGDPNNPDNNYQELSLDKDDYTKEEFEELMKELENMVNGKYLRESLTNSQFAEMSSLDAAGAVMTDVGDEFVGKAKCVVYRKLTESLLDSSLCTFGSSKRINHMLDSNNTPISQGLRLGSMLASRLTVLADESTISYNRLPTGKIDKRLIHSLGFDNENVFEQSQVIKREPIFIHLSIDSSGSMVGVKWFQALKLAAALAKVASKISTIDLVISFRASDDLVRVLIAYDSRVDPLSKVISLFPRLSANGSTPEGLAFDSLKDIISEDCAATRRFFINISDGQPSHLCDLAGTKVSYSGEKAHAHTRRRMNALRQSGVHVLSYFVSDAESGEARDEEVSNSKAFQEMYGRDAKFINVQSVTDIARTMNQMMLAGEASLDK